MPQSENKYPVKHIVLQSKQDPVEAVDIVSKSENKDAVKAGIIVPRSENKEPVPAVDVVVPIAKTLVTGRF